MDRMLKSQRMKNHNFNSLLSTRRGMSLALAAAGLMGIPFIAHANDYHNQNEDQDRSIRVFFPLRVVSGFLDNLGVTITSHSRRAVPRNPSPQYQQGGARDEGQSIPRGNSMETSVQLALTRSGYYNGPIDGDIGPMSRRAISNYQADRGFRITGYPDNQLLISLGLQ